MKELTKSEDTHRKCKLAGWIIKAGVDDETSAVIYGFLLEIKEKLESDDASLYRREWRIKGDIALTNEKLLKNHKN